MIFNGNQPSFLVSRAGHMADGSTDDPADSPADYSSDSDAARIARCTQESLFCFTQQPVNKKHHKTARSMHFFCQAMQKHAATNPETTHARPQQRRAKA